VVRRTSSLRPGLLSLLLGALILRMLVPAGFMIAATPAGAAALVLCDGTVPAAHTLHHHPEHDAPAAPAHHQQAPCPYAALATPVLPPLPAAFAPPAPPAQVPPAAPSAKAAGFTRGASLLPPSTGPPRTA
jgi:hypothetical protein